MHRERFGCTCHHSISAAPKLVTAIRQWLTFGALGLGSACADPLPPAAVPHPTALRAVTQRPKHIRPEEQEFDDLAQRFPGFAGFYRSPAGDLILLTTRGSEKPALQAEAARLSAEKRATFRDTPILGVRVADAKYSFWTRAEIRDLIFEQGLGKIQGLHALDLDEQANRVQIDVTPEHRETAPLEVRRLLRDAGLDTTALSVVASPRAQVASAVVARMAAPPIGSTLTSASDELVGGLLWTAKPRVAMCSVGSVIDRNGTRGFVTASHCTGTINSLDSAQAWQPDTLSGSHVATETRDPDGTMCYYSGNDHQWGWFDCRFSNAAFFATTGAMTMQKGLIARPEYSVSTWGDSGTRVIDTAKPFFIVTATAGSFGAPASTCTRSGGGLGGRPGI